MRALCVADWYFACSLAAPGLFPRFWVGMDDAVPTITCYVTASRGVRTCGRSAFVTDPAALRLQWTPCRRTRLWQRGWHRLRACWALSWPCYKGT